MSLVSKYEVYMAINLFVDGRNFGDKGSGFAVVLHGAWPGQKRVHHWERSFVSLKEPANQAMLRGIHYALYSIKREIRSEPVVVWFNNKYVYSMLQRDNGEYKRQTRSDLVVAVRKIVEQYKKIEFVQETDDRKNADRVKKLCEMVVKDGKAVDNRN